MSAGMDELSEFLPWLVGDDCVELMAILRERERRIDRKSWREGYKQGREQGRREAWSALFAGLSGWWAWIMGRSWRQ